jgi:pimeloyl-ACP methyl ester carboxylesterase
MRIPTNTKSHPQGNWQNIIYVLALLLISTLAACAKKPVNEIFLMPAPDVYDAGAIDPFTDTDPIKQIPYGGILYATDREPSSGEGKEAHYLNKRGFVLRLGVGKIELGDENITWEEARKISLLKNRAANYPLKVNEIEEIGILAGSYSVFNRPQNLGPEASEPEKLYADKINEKLVQSARKDIYIYVHGYKVVFENPLLVASELWHFLGYDGVFIAYSWPSTPKNLAYFSDLETTSLSAYNFRIFLEYLARETKAENIHIIGYSAGTRLVINGLGQLAFMYKDETKEAFRKYLRIGHVILTASDFDRQLYGSYINDGILDVAKDTTIYLSELDSALSLSKWIFNRQRLGQMWADRKLPDGLAELLWQADDLYFVDVSDVEKAATGNGHAYFRNSPWVSSDILATLMYDLSPQERGLYHSKDWPIWQFPQDYITRLTAKLVERNPALAPLK